MKGASASILSPAAELATRGMDSADEEPELPYPVQYFIRRLGEFKSFVLEHSLLRRPEVKPFFPEGAPLSTNTGWRSQVRLRVLEAIGSCTSSSEKLDVAYIFGNNISTLTASEWEVVLRGFRSSSVLRNMTIDRLTWSSKADLESLGLQLGIILNTSSVADLRICQGGLTARFFLNLASGLRENSHSILKSLEVIDAWGDPNAVKFIVEVLNGHHQLETLKLFSSYGGEDYVDDADYGEEDYVYDAPVRLLSQTLKQNSCLKELVLQGGGYAALLRYALAGDDGNRSIEQLELGRMSGIGKSLAEVFLSNRSLRVVTLKVINMPVEEWRLLGEAIRDNATATTVNIDTRLSHRYFNELKELSCAASSDGKEPLLHLEMHNIVNGEYYQLIDKEGNSPIYIEAGFQLLSSVLRGEIKSVKFLSLRLEIRLERLEWKELITQFGIPIEDILPMNGITGETSRLKRLKLKFGPGGFRLWKHLVQSLRWNTSVTSLTLSFNTPMSQSVDLYDEEAEELFRDLMALLQVNLTLKAIDVSESPWARNGKAALIEAALKQNQERAVYMSVFTEAKLQFGDAKAGRLFLCGSPGAGKTQLRRTLMKIVRDKTWMRETVEKLSRTKGIEVDFLLNNEEMQISIWDLAGQWIFRTLQNVLFPQTNDFCVFLFVYSPVVEKTSSHKPPSSFRTELEGWLTFISSSTKVTGHNLPQVLVVISHKDKMGSTSLNWVHSIVEELKVRFANYVDLCPLQDFFYVNARERNQVIPLKNHIFEMFKSLLSENSPRVPQLCFQLSSLLLSNIKKDKTCPLWSLEKFSVFCDSSLKQLILPSSVDHTRLLNSLVSYLNDVGIIIYIPNLDHIIVHPSWLTNSILGELIAMGQHFQAEESNAYEMVMSSDSYTSKDGFVSESVFTGLMETFLKKQSRFQNVDREILEKILFNLDLGFKLEDSFQYFIPSFIPEYASMEEQKQQEGACVVSMSWSSKVANPNFVGIRIRCEDLKTMSLSAAFFPRFQMFMRRKLKSGTVTLSRHYLQLLLDGHEIYVEHFQSEKSHNYVDVLMLCSEHKSKEESIKYVLKHIVQELISFCASPKGCPGVALVLGVIQTVCVEKMIPSHLRGAILIEELKSEFSTSINDKLGDFGLDGWQLVKEEELLNYEYTWPEIPDLHLKATSERATNLLWERDVEAVVNGIRKKRHQLLESLQQSLVCLNDDLAHSHPESEITVSNSSLSHRKDCNLDSASCSGQASTSGDTQLLLFKMDQIEGKIDGVHETVRSVESIVQGLDVKLGQIISLQQQLQSTFSNFMSKVDRIIEYSESYQQARTPKRPYVTDDVGIFYKMSARLHLGTTVCLRLMCEAVTGFHPVKNQEGLKLRLDLENSGWIPKIIEISYKVLYYAVKAGLTATLQLGEAIPQWDDLKTDILKLDGISKLDGRAIRKGGHSEELNEAWLRIQQTLEPQLKDSYSKIFRLYQVKYENGGHAWVCEECMRKGRLSRIL